MEQIRVNLTGELINVRLEELNPFQEDIKTLSDENYEKLKTAILKDGFSFSIHVFELEDSSLWVLDGHQRLACLLRMKEEGFQIPTLPCVMVEAESLEHARRLVLEGTSQYGSFQASALIDFSKKTGIQPKEQLDRFALPSVDLAKLINVSGHTRSIGENEVPEPPKNPKTKRGNIYQLGDHRLMCGDSTMIDDVEKLMDGEKADMVFTDPPYNQETEGGFKSEVGAALKKQSKEIAHLCDFNPEIFLGILPTIFNKNKMNAYCFCNKDLVVDYLKWARDSGFAYNILIWKKPTAIPIGGSYRPDVEYLLVFRKSGIFNGALKEVNYSKVLEHKRETDKVHPTMKPVEMIENQLKIASNDYSIVVDLFGGSGSTLIACEKTNRKCFMMELDPKYCDVIVARWEKYTGKKAVLL